MKKEIVRRIKIPITRDSVLSPQVHYGHSHYDEPVTGIYFVTSDDKHGRITFENFDALKVCRGEMLPYEYDWSAHEKGVWVFKVENSNWLMHRYKYEKEHYGDSYEFGGNVEEIKTDFNHYLFSFHDQFIEVIARGFWFEESDDTLFEKPLQEDHPSLPLPKSDKHSFDAYDITCQVRINHKAEKEIIQNTRFCTQKLMEFALELDGKATVNHKLTVSSTKGEVISHLCSFFGRKEIYFPGIVSLEEVQPYLKKYMKEVSERRKK